MKAAALAFQARHEAAAPRPRGEVRWGVICFCVLFVLTVASMEFGDWWRMRSDPTWSRLHRVVYHLAGAAFTSLVFAIGLTWLRGLARAWQAVFLAWCAYFGVLLLATWPGYMLTDSVAAFVFGLKYPIDQWLGFFTPFLYTSIVSAFPRIGAVTALQLLICAGVLVYCGQVLTLVTRRPLASVLFFLLIAASPSAVFNFLLLSRDTLFSVMVLWLAAFVLRQFYLRDGSWSSFGVAGCIGGCAVVLRGDGWLVLLPLLAIMWFIAADRRRLLLLGSAAALIIAVYGLLMPAWLGARHDAFSYRVANTVNPLGYVLQSRHMQDPGKHVAQIARVVDIDIIREKQTPYEIEAWWTGKLIHEDATDEDKRRYFGAVGKLLFENIGIYLAGRVETFFGASGFYQSSFRYGDAFGAGWPHESIHPGSLRLDPAAGRPFPALYGPIDLWIRESTVYEPGKVQGSVVHWNIIPALIILAACLLAYGALPGVALASLIVLIRVPAVMLLAPASQYKYYLSAELAGAFLFAAAVFLLLLRARPPRTKPRAGMPQAGGGPAT
ncbi:hypothetical protein K6V92_20900 [Cupriavidus respiraculi]|uniref:hypothetical protein n=1 Tax=Cupriavidus respiraculi TaxID=195930 RepID=UPI001C973598|nr:hypothetical protein [Cupriavidus respiraculi]MBY4949064.1 hypothetical protein [Cupriavidus respiraculi]